MTPESVPHAWHKFAFRSYLALQSLDGRLLEPRLPANLFYNLMVSGRRPSLSFSSHAARPKLGDDGRRSRSHDFPLFPLPVVLLPTEVVPLHIFEDRYKTMISLCIDEGSEFGIVWLSDDGLKEIGCTAQRRRGARADGGRAHEHPRARR